MVQHGVLLIMLHSVLVQEVSYLSAVDANLYVFLLIPGVDVHH